MLNIIFRSSVVALLVSVVSYICLELLSVDNEFAQWCKETAYQDIKCAEIKDLENNNEAKKLANYLTFMAYFSEFVLVFISCILLGGWNWLRPVARNVEQAH